METETALAVMRPGQLVVLALFMLALGLGWLLVKMNQGGLSRRLHQGKRMKLAEVTSLSPTDRALILEVDGRSFLVIRCKGAAPLLHELGPTAVSAEVTP